jgi:hypothetical protein
MSDETYAVDLDGTLAEYGGWKNDRSVGKPIPAMMDRVKKWMSEGINIVIFTARADDPENIPAIIEWLKDQGLSELEISNIKTPEMSRFYDDRAVQVEKNTGKLLSKEESIEEWMDLSTFKLQSMYKDEEN